jgi:putative transcriptional regulator
MVLFMVFNCVWEQVKTLKKMKGMAMNYNKLWKLLIDRNLMKKDLIQMAGITTNAMAKMGKGGDVSTQVLSKICKALDCKIEDIVEVEKTIDSP